ncbi:hypothetical protein [Ruminococcus sp.]|uniref:hypothetical protein n=1 Tax=Ruminococcus sp. TaxID=41978 RepID=UPI00388DF39A
MTNNNRFNNENNRHIRRSSDRARAITKAKAKKQNIILTSTAIALVALVAAGFIVFGAIAPKTKTADAPVTSVSVNKDANKAAQVTKKTDSQIATQAAQAKAPTTVQVVSGDHTQNSTQAQTDNTPSNTQAQTDNTQDTTQAQPTEKSSDTTKNAQEKKSEDKIETVNGERIYIDTKRQAPEKTGTPAHYYANGKTSYGFDWTYDADNSNFTIRCDYNFNQQQYDFQFYGTAPGTSHITVYYNTDDNTKVPVSLTLTVDDNLNASIG